jgi:hypothetical protein
MIAPGLILALAALALAATVARAQVIFSAPDNFAAGGPQPQSVAMGDLNGDKRPDLAVANQNSNNVSVLLGDGTGRFGAPTSFPVGDEPVSVAVGDLNGDGRPDLAATNAGPAAAAETASTAAAGETASTVAAGMTG